MTKKKNIGLPREKQTWAIRGIDAETRTACQMAARRAGMTVGDWCNRALRDAATGDIQKPNVPASKLEDTLAALVTQMQADREQRERQAMAQREQAEVMSARLSAIEARTEPKEGQGHQGAQNPLARLYGLLRGK